MKKEVPSEIQGLLASHLSSSESIFLEPQGYQTNLRNRISKLNINVNSSYGFQCLELELFITKSLKIKSIYQNVNIYHPLRLDGPFICNTNFPYSFSVPHFLRPFLSCFHVFLHWGQMKEDAEAFSVFNIGLLSTLVAYLPGALSQAHAFLPPS